MGTRTERGGKAGQSLIDPRWCERVDSEWTKRALPELPAAQTVGAEGGEGKEVKTESVQSHDRRAGRVEQGRGRCVATAEGEVVGMAVAMKAWPTRKLPGESENFPTRPANERAGSAVT